MRNPKANQDQATISDSNSTDPTLQNCKTWLEYRGWGWNLVVAGTELGDDDPFILYWYRLLWLSIPKCTIFLNLSQGSSPTNSSSLYTFLNPFWWHYNHIVSSRRVIASHPLRFIRWSPHHFKYEAMLHVRSWGTSISQADWYCSSANLSSYGVWAASDMETFSLWSDEVCHLVWDQFIVSDSPKLDQLLSSDIRSPSVHTQSRTWVTDYLIACLPLQEGLRLYVGSNEYVLLPTHWHYYIS